MHGRENNIWRWLSWSRHVLWEHPEWWSLSLSLLAWLFLFVSGDRAGTGLMLWHQHHLPMAMGTISPNQIASTWFRSMTHWVVMVIAMMLPLVSDSIRNTAARNMWERRHRAILSFIFGYLGIWTIAGALFCAITSAVQFSAMSPSIGTAAALAVAAAWQFSPARQRALRSCHRTVPLAPYGWRAYLDCFHYGRIIGTACVVSCWPLMAACLLAGHDLGVMIFAGSIGIAERYLAQTTPRLLGGALAGVSLIVAVKMPF